jgi:hypothetical protein
MTVRAFNKVTRRWLSTEDGSELTPSQDWIINPVFEDEAFAMQIGQEFWTFDGATVKTPSQAEYDAIMLARIKERRWLQIQDERTRRQAGGVFISAVNKWFHSDQTSRIQQLGLVMMGASLPNNIQWKTMDGSFITMTPAIAMAIFNGAAVLDMTAFAVAEQHRANMVASPDPANYDFSAGWPAIFTG